MAMLIFRVIIGLLIALNFGSSVSSAENEPPRSLDQRLKIELFAEHPTIVTPTGIDVDHAGRVWAIESNTHFPPEGYQRHNSDRIWVMADTNNDGKADKVTQFTDGLKYTMSIAVRRSIWLVSQQAQEEDSKNGEKFAERKTRKRKPRSRALDVFIATRRAIFIYTDDDGDLKADRHKTIVHLETAGNYPHNGLAGFAFDAMGWMYFGFGENLGADYKIIGSDGTTLSGGGEGGNIYRCRPDGTKLKQWATGFWNPHASCMDAFGRLFTVDNDPDSRPPCRLLHIIRGGDYGYRFSNGRKGLHPFTAWNGEIPGTLPMVAGTGEAPSGIVAYESDGLPKEYIGNLLVTSWGDHRIDRFRLKPKGASFESLAETVIQGGEEFRPVGIAVAPDGSLFCTDWVKRDYKLHGHGRIWRISMKDEPKRKVIDVSAITAIMEIKELKEMLKSPRLDVRRVAAESIRLNPNYGKSFDALTDDESILRRGIQELVWAECSLVLTGLDRELVKRRFIGHGRINTLPGTLELTDSNLADIWRVRGSIEEGPADKANDFLSDPFMFSAVVNDIAFASEKRFRVSDLSIVLKDRKERLRNRRKREQSKELGYLAYTVAARIVGRNDLETLKVLRMVLSDPSPVIRRFGVQWAAEVNFTQLKGNVASVLDSEPMTTDLFLATLAALEMLDGIPPQDFDKTPASKYVLPIVKDAKRSAAVRAQALRLVDPNEPELNVDLLNTLLSSKNEALRLETVRTLQHRPGKESAALLKSVASDEKNDINLRAEAVAGLAMNLQKGEIDAASKQFLVGLLQGDNQKLQVEAIRSLQSVVASDEGIRQAIEGLSKKPGRLHPLLAEQVDLAMGRTSGGLHPPLADELITGGDAAAGRRIFFHVNSAGCYKCHTVNGRGGKVGPDLSIIARTMNRKKLAQSILEPSKEISPQFTMWTFVMESGQVHNGMILGDVRKNVQQIGTPEGKVIELKTDEIEERHPQTKSLMPEKLIERLTLTEFRDLLAYLETLK